MLLAERLTRATTNLGESSGNAGLLVPPPSRLHALAEEFQLSETEVLDLIASARRLKMAVRGWVAEEHLVRRLISVPGVSECRRIDEEGGPDVRLLFEGEPLTVECKNVLRQTTASGLARVDFQRTRVSKGDRCSRYYAASEFNVVAACMHAVTEKWEFRYVLPSALDRHRDCADKLASNVKVDHRWTAQPLRVLREATA